MSDTYKDRNKKNGDSRPVGKQRKQRRSRADRRIYKQLVRQANYEELEPVRGESR